MRDYSRIKALLLEQDTFPLDFTFKFIGYNSPKFADGVSQLEKAFPTLKAAGRKETTGGLNVSLTYQFVAPSADAIIEVFRALEKVEDIRIVL